MIGMAVWPIDSRSLIKATFPIQFPHTLETFFEESGK